MDIRFFVENVKSILDKRGISYARAGRESGTGVDFIRKMENYGTTPSIEKVCKMADYLGVTVGELLGEEKKPTPAEGGELDRNTIKIVGRNGTRIERELTDEQVALIKTMLDQLKPVDDGTL